MCRSSCAPWLDATQLPAMHLGDIKVGKRHFLAPSATFDNLLIRVAIFAYYIHTCHEGIREDLQGNVDSEHLEAFKNGPVAGTLRGISKGRTWPRSLGSAVDLPVKRIFCKHRLECSPADTPNMQTIEPHAGLGWEAKKDRRWPYCTEAIATILQQTCGGKCTQPRMKTA